MVDEPQRSLAGHLAEFHERDWGRGNPGHPEQRLKTIMSSETLAELLWSGAGPREKAAVVHILEEWEDKGWVGLAKPMGEDEVLVTAVNVGALRMWYNL
jgi:hypothetical protein